MEISSFGVDCLPEEPEIHHVLDGEFIVAIDAVFEHHAVASRAFRRVDELPGLLDIVDDRHLDGDVLSVFHRPYCNRQMEIWRRGDEDHVDVVAFAYFPPPVRVGRIEDLVWIPLLLQLTVDGVELLLV